MDESRSKSKRSDANRSRAKRPQYRKRGLLLVLTAVFAVCLGVLVYEQRPAQAPSTDSAIEPLPESPPKPPPEPVEFHMADFGHGWLRYSDGAMKTTSDGGATWQVASSEQDSAGGAVPTVGAGTGAGMETGQGPGNGAGTGLGTDARPKAGAEAPTGRGELYLTPAEQPKLETIEFEAKAYPVKQSQFVTDRIGWALLGSAAEWPIPLLVTTDGGATWRAEVTAEVREAVEEERKREALAAREAALLGTPEPEQARQAMRASWLLLPSQASVGDVVLVRHNEPGEVEWQGKTYQLQSFGTGYYTYLPISMQVKPGEYPVGEAMLTVKAKKFQTQYLQVSQQLESMRQDTARIQADQKKIDAARSKSEPEFLYDSAFIQPVQGILTTPYGYTRYVNGKWDSSHTAIDLAAKEGTPIQATNDGVVALADSLYLTGNAIYLDHGMGLFSQYAHLSELRVKTGDRVKKGDIIGLVGSTGFSTGPHLHFTFWAHNVPTNPNLFFGTTPFSWNDQGN